MSCFSEYLKGKDAEKNACAMQMNKLRKSHTISGIYLDKQIPITVYNTKYFPQHNKIVVNY